MVTQESWTSEKFSSEREPELLLESLSVRVTGKSSPWSRLRALVALESRDLWAIGLYAVVLGALSLGMPVAAQVLVNTIALGSLIQPLVVLSILLLAVLLLSAAVQVVEWYTVEVLQRRLFVRIAEDFARRLPRVSRDASSRLDLRELTNRFFEVASIQKSAGLLLVEGLGLLLQTLTGLLLLAFYHPALLTFDLCLIAALALVLVLGRGAVDSARKESAAKYQVGAWLENIASSPTLTATSSARSTVLQVADRLVRKYLDERRRHYRRVLAQLITGSSVRVLAMVALLGLGGWLVIQGELTLGQLVAAELVVGAVGVGFAKLGKYFEVAYDLLAGLDKLGKVLDLPLRRPNVRRIPLPENTLLRLDRVKVMGASGQPSAELSADIREGERVWVLGAAGSGKTVLLETIAGLRPASSGSVYYGLAERKAPYISDPFLLRPNDILAGTILFNLRLGRADLDEAGAWRALQLAQLDNVVAGLDQGLHTELSPSGTPLSASQLGRLAVARAFAAQPALLLIDGRFSDLGADEEDRVDFAKLLLAPERPWTVILVSDEVEVGGRCTQILELDDSDATPDADREEREPA